MATRARPVPIDALKPWDQGTFAISRPDYIAPSGSVLEALHQGLTEAATGNTTVAQAWLERGRRLDPDNASVTLALATLRLSQGNTDAAELFARLALDHDMKEVWLGLSFARLLQGDAAQAADAIGQALRRHVFTAADVDRNFNAIARAIGAPGWCALVGPGQLTVQLTHPFRPGLMPTVAVDRRQLALRVQPDGRTFNVNLPKGWERSSQAVIRLADQELLGSPMAIDTMVHVEGFVDTTDGDLNGWAWCPNDPDRTAVLTILPVKRRGCITLVADGGAADILHKRPLARPRTFQIPAELLRRF